MKVILIIILVIIVLVCWAFATSATVNNKHAGKALIVKSIAYFIAVILSFLIGLTI